MKETVPRPVLRESSSAPPVARAPQEGPGPGSAADRVVADAHRRATSPLAGLVAGSGAARFPHQATVEAAFGRPLPAVSTVVGRPEVASLGAVTDGRHVAFAAANPDLEVAAHEAAHLYQRQGGATPPAPGFDRPGGPAEQEAGRAAARVVQGEPVGPLQARPEAALQAWNPPPGLLRSSPGGAFRLAAPLFELPEAVAALREAVRRGSGEDVLRVLASAPRLEDRRALQESYGETFFGDVWGKLSTRQRAEATPRLAGVVPAWRLLAQLDGAVWNDARGAKSLVEGLPVEEVREGVEAAADGFEGSPLDRLLDALGSTVGWEADEAWLAARSLAVRVSRLPGLDPALKARVASEIRVKAAGGRMRAAWEGRSPGLWGSLTTTPHQDRFWLTLADLRPAEREALYDGPFGTWAATALPASERDRLRDVCVEGDPVRALATVLAEADVAGGEGLGGDLLGRDLAAQAVGTLMSEVRRGELPGWTEEDAAVELLRPGMAELLGEAPGGGDALDAAGFHPDDVLLAKLEEAPDEDGVVALLATLDAVERWLFLERPEVRRRLAARGIDTGPGSRVDRYLHALDQVNALAAGEAPVVFLGLAGPASSADSAVVVAAHDLALAWRRDNRALAVGAVAGLGPQQRRRLADEPEYGETLVAMRGAWTTAWRRLAEEIERCVATGASPDQDTLYDIAVPPGDRGTERVEDEQLLAEAVAAEPDLQAEYRKAWVQRHRDGGLLLEEDPIIAEGLDLRLGMVEGTDPVVEERMMLVILGQPDLTRTDGTPEELALEADFIRLRAQQLVDSTRSGLDLSGVTGWSPQHIDEGLARVDQLYNELGWDGWTPTDLCRLAEAWYQLQDAVLENRQARDAVADAAIALGAGLAGVLVTVATGGAGAPAAAAIVAGAVSGTVLGAGVGVAMGTALTDYRSPDEQLEDLGAGALEGLLGALGGYAAGGAGRLASASVRTLGSRASIATTRVLARVPVSLAENVAFMAVHDVGANLVHTAIERETWRQGVLRGIARMMVAVGEGLFTGVATGTAFGLGMGALGVGGALLGPPAQRLAARAGVELGLWGQQATRQLEMAALYAEAGLFEDALRLVDVMDVPLAQRNLLAASLQEQAVAKVVGGARLSPTARRLLARAQEAASGGDARALRAALDELEAQASPAVVQELRFTLFARFRLSPSELGARESLARHYLRTWLRRSAEPGVPDPPFDVLVVPGEAFEGMFGEAAGMAALRIEGETAVVYVNGATTLADDALQIAMVDEVAALRQLQRTRAAGGGAPGAYALSEQRLAGWSQRSAHDRVEILRTQLGVELEAQALQREWAAGWGDSAAATVDASAAAYADDLTAMAAELDALTPDRLARIDAGLEPMPAFLDTAPRLFKRRVTRPSGHAAELSGEALETARGAARRVTDSTSVGPGTEVYQVGAAWKEIQEEVCGVAGEVVEVVKVGKGETTVVRVAPEGGGPVVSYELPVGAPSKVRVADRVRPGDLLGTIEREYRLVDVRTTAGRELQQEIRSLTTGRWRLRGAEATREGLLVEAAANAEIRRALGTRAEAAAPGTFWWREISGKVGSGGFDGVFLEMEQVGGGWRARVRIVETKSYPRSDGVPLEEFTAIRPGGGEGRNLEQNLEALTARLGRVQEELAAAGRTGEAEALERVINGQHYQVEIHLGPDTVMGAEGAGRHTVLAKLREELANSGTNVRLVTGAPTPVSREAVNAARVPAASGAGRPEPP